MMPPPRRKKWTEAEERTLIDKYMEMVYEGTLTKMKTREKKYRPIALHVNSVHHLHDPITYPWIWTWKDVSIKVQNMRHQYSLVKQKIKKVDAGPDSGNVEEYDWIEGLTHWSNFVRYKEVFSDMHGVVGGSSDSIALIGECNDNKGVELEDFAHGFDGIENEVMGLEFDYDREEVEDNNNNDNDDNNNNNEFHKSDSFVKDDEVGEANNNEFHKSDSFVKDDEVGEANRLDSRKKRKMLKGMETKAWRFVAKQLLQLKEMEARFEQQEAERENERTRRESVLMEMEQERERKWEQREKEREEREKSRDLLRRKRIQEMEEMEKEMEERERRRREEEIMYEKESEEKMNQRISDWKKRMDDVVNQHRTEIGEIHGRLLHEQQSVSSQLLGIVTNWTGHSTGLSDHTGTTSHYLSQMMHNMHHVSGLVHEDDARDDGDNQEDQFIVDG